jgi:hypothetical protein
VTDAVVVADPLKEHLDRLGAHVPAGELLAVEFLTGVKPGWMS